jgi:hypothetical protein
MLTGKDLLKAVQNLPSMTETTMKPHPPFTSVTFHESYNAETREGKRYFAPTMTALDRRGQVWRNWQRLDETWVGWVLVP